MKDGLWIEEAIKKVSRRIGEIRIEKGITQAGLAVIMDLEQRYLRRLVKNRNMTLRNLFRFMAALDCDITEFFNEPKTNRNGPGRPKKKRNEFLGENDSKIFKK
jgi:transcriptional regulator with XRE-family HTH domain